MQDLSGYPGKGSIQTGGIVGLKQMIQSQGCDPRPCSSELPKLFHDKFDLQMDCQLTYSESLDLEE